MSEVCIPNSVKVSIIMPAFNASKYILESIESVQKQTYTNWELIIIDDCSTDNTAEIVQSVSKADNRIFYLKNERNVGVAQTRNNGIDCVTGDFIAFLDSDDLWLPQKLEKQLNFMIQNGYVFSFSSYQKFDSESGQLGKIITAPNVVTADEILGNTIIGCLTVMFDVHEVGKVYMPNVNHMEDNITWFSILKRGYQAYGVSEVLARYREGNSSLTNNKGNAVKKQWKVYRNYFGFSIFKSIRYFFMYSLNAVKKHF